MAYSTLLYEVSDGVATLTLNRPEKLNAFDDQLKTDLLAGLKEAEKDASVRVLVITASGRAFCSGQDLNLRDPGEDGLDVGQMLRTLYHPIFVKLRTLPKPIIAALNGLCAGMGMSLALACDYRIGVEGSYLTQAFIKIGLIPDCGSTFFLPRMVGLGRAFELAALGDKIDNQKALEWGLLNEVVPADKLIEAVKTRADQLAKGPTAAYGLLKRALNHSIGMHFEDQLEFESYTQSIASKTADFAEGVQSFIEKRPPAFAGN